MAVHDKSQIQRFFNEIIDKIKRYQLLATPENYRLWFEYAADLNAGLKKDIDQLVEDRARLTDNICAKLYKKHIANNDAKQLDQTNAAIKEMLEAIVGHLGTWDQSATKFNSALEQCTHRLESDPSVEEVREIVKSVTTETREMTLAQNVAQSSIQTSLLSLNDEISALRDDVDRLGNEAMTDPLTQVANRRAFDTALVEHISTSKSDGQALTLMMADIDFFKRINDDFGHPVGDKILRFLATIMHKNIRSKDFLYRYGGEEFAVILPNTDTEGALKVAEHIRKAVSSKQLTTGKAGQIIGRVTVSVGVAMLRSNENADAFVDRADKQLYKAKDIGRDTVCVETN